MNTLKTLILTLALALLALPSWGADLTIDDLVERNDLYYKKFTNEPFTGKVSGKQNGKFKDGKSVGEWEEYHENGQLKYVENYSDGKREGYWEYFNEDGTVDTERTGTYKNGVKQD